MSDSKQAEQAKGVTTKPDGAPQERARTAESKPTPSAGALAKSNAAESGDPAVHQLLAERQTANMNGDEAAVQRIDHELDKLGFGG